MSKKNVIFIIIAIMLIVILSIVKINQKKISDEQIGETTNVIATKKSNGTFEIYNTDIKTDTGSTKFTATVKNVSGSRTEEQQVEIVLLNVNGFEIGTMLIVVPSLENGVATNVEAENLTVYENIYDFTIK